MGAHDRPSARFGRPNRRKTRKRSDCHGRPGLRFWAGANRELRSPGGANVLKRILQIVLTTKLGMAIIDRYV